MIRRLLPRSQVEVLLSKLREIALQTVGLAIVLGAAQAATAQAWLAEADQRIEQYRKADLTVAVVDSLGNPVPGADVHVEMKRHKFGWGTAVTADWINNNSPTGNTYKQKLLENFNQVVFENDLKWPAWDGIWGGFSWTETSQALDWLDANDLPTRGHYLSWATWSGSDAYGGSLNVNTLQNRLFNHITDIAGTVGNRVFEWDVINHPVGWLNDTYENRMAGVGPYADGLEFYSAIVDHARAAAPEGMPMWINEDDVIAGTSRANDYERIIDWMIADGTPVDGIGFQGHFIEEWGRVSGTPAAAIFERIDRFADKGVPLRVTEFDIDVGNNDALQGQLTNDYLIAIFSHPDIEAITLWGFWGGSHWRGENGALYENNWTEKPSLTAYQNLVFNEWWTNEMGSSDTSGVHGTRAFKGEYEITVTYNGQDYLLGDLVVDGDMSVQIELDDVILTPIEDADFNDDDIVDGLDFLIWQRGVGTGATLSEGDANGDMLVDADDLEIWNAQYGTPGGLFASAAAVPEPTGITVVLTGMFALLSIRPNRRAANRTLSN